MFKQSNRKSSFKVAVVAFGMLVPSLAFAQPARVPPAENPEDQLTAQDRRILAYARDCAGRITKTMESWIDSNRVSKERLFAYIYYPVIGTDPQKFTTDYDKLSDKEIFPIQEECLAKEPEIKFVVTVDKNGYLPTHNATYSKPLSGRRQIDLVYNRTKRIFNDRTGIKAARNMAPFLLQTYQRDTGEMMKDLSVPLIVGGQHWGGLRFGYMPK
jgi:hypothetical protein